MRRLSFCPFVARIEDKEGSLPAHPEMPSMDSLRYRFQARRARAPVLHRRLADFDCASLHRTLKRLVQRGFGFLILLLRDSTLFVFDLELEDLFFQSFEQER